jgi:hypothetical protein
MKSIIRIWIIPFLVR